jgi:hypothetical protein
MKNIIIIILNQHIQVQIILQLFLHLPTYTSTDEKSLPNTAFDAAFSKTSSEKLKSKRYDDDDDDDEDDDEDEDDDKVKNETHLTKEVALGLT